MFYVYAYLRSIDFTPYYIGKGHGNRAWSKKHSVVVPKDPNRIVILERNLTEVGALALERRMVRWYGRQDINTGILRNQTDGGDGVAGIIPWNRGLVGVFIPSNESRQRMSKAGLGKPKSNEHRKNISKGSKGKPKSNEHKKRISESLKGNIPWNKGKTGVQEIWAKGKKFTDEHRKNLSKSKRGKGPLSDEHKQKISASLKGRTMSEETKQRMSEARKKVWNERKNRNS
jgi:hypothetical protein